MRLLESALTASIAGCNVWVGFDMFLSGVLQVVKVNYVRLACELC